ncbi:hypothetical protein BDV19DRAFT_188389 [Aspergillus venezuelensis]
MDVYPAQWSAEALTFSGRHSSGPVSRTPAFIRSSAPLSLQLMIASSHALTASFFCSSLSDSATFVHCVPGAPRADAHLQSSPEFLSPVFPGIFRLQNLVEEAPAPPSFTIQFFSCFLLKTDTWRPCRSSITCPSILSVAHPFINFPVAISLCLDWVVPL